MRALVLTQARQPMVLVDDFAVDKPKEHEVLVRTAACGVCHSDLHFRQGKWTTFPLPLVLGHECSGVVVEVGSQVSYLRPGDHVVGCLTAFCGECPECLTGRMFICSSRSLVRGPSETSRLRWGDQPVNQFVNLSGFAEMMLVHERSLVKIPRDIPLDVAATLGCAVITGVGAAVNTAQVRPGDTVAVVGCGGIGLNVIQGARIAGAEQIIAIDSDVRREEGARMFGATDFVLSDDATVEHVLEQTEGGVDHAFEAVGLKATAELAFRLTRAGGQAIIVGLLPEGTSISVDAQSLTFDRRLRGSNMGSNRFRVDIPKLLAMYASGRLMLEELISARIGLDEVDDALAAMDRQNTIRRAVAVMAD